MRKFFESLNGWKRLYTAFLMLWLAFTAFSLYESVPKKSAYLSGVKFEVIKQFEDELGRIRLINDPTQRKATIDGACIKTKIDKQECAKFLINPDEFSITSKIMLMAQLREPMVSKRTKQIEEELMDKMRPQIMEAAINHAWQAIFLPAVVLLSGLAVAWIRRGFLKK